MHGEMRNVYKILVRELEGKRPFRRQRQRWEDNIRIRWEDNIRMDITEIGWEDAEWICLAQDRDQW
jgi:hypothetical protein